jgi:hypothetical protein
MIYIFIEIGIKISMTFFTEMEVETLFYLIYKSNSEGIKTQIVKLLEENTGKVF